VFNYLVALLHRHTESVVELAMAPTGPANAAGPAARLAGSMAKLARSMAKLATPHTEGKGKGKRRFV